MLHIFKHELRLILRDPRFWIPFIVPPAILAASQAIAAFRYGADIAYGQEGYIMLLLGCLMAPMGAPLSADSFAGERERNSLELLQLTPVKPTQLFAGKLLAVMPFPTVFALLVQIAYWLNHSNISTVVAICAMILAISSVLITTSFSLLVSLHTKTVRAATQLSLFVIVPLLLLVQLFHGYFFNNIIYCIIVFALSTIICALSAIVGLRKFIAL